MADGSITFSTELDNKELEKQLTGLSKKIDRIQDKIGQKKAEQLPLVEQSKKLAAELDLANSKLESMRNNSSFSAAAIKEQESTTKGLQSRWSAVQSKVDSYDTAIKNSTIELERSKDKAGAMQKQLAVAGGNSRKMSEAVKRADRNMGRFQSRMKEIVKSALVFTVISQGLVGMREWIGKVIKTNDEANASIARLKGALLTLAQPLVEVAIPAFTTFVNVLTAVVNQISKLVSIAFGTTAEKSAEAAKSLYGQTEALDDTGKAAKKTSKELAAFDEVNRIGDKSDTGDKSGKIDPDFGGATSSNWLKERLGESAQMVADAVTLGGIALVALGAATGSLPLVVAGLGLIIVGFTIGAQTGTLDKWVDVLNLNNVTELIWTAVSLGGIALVAIGAATGNILVVIAGLALLGKSISHANNSGMMQDWRESLGINMAPAYVTAAVFLGGIALVAIGAMSVNPLMILAGLGLLAAGIYVGTQSGTLQKWAEALGLDTVFEQVTAAVMLAGFALIAVGAATGNIFMVIAGGLLVLGSAIADSVGEKQLKEWWEVLKLTSVQQWVAVACLLVGIALVAIGVVMANLLMIVGGAALIGLGLVVGSQNNNLKDWVSVLGLQKVVGWIAVALSLVGIALVAIGAATGNVIMVIAGLALLAAGIGLAAQSGALQKWWETLNLSEVANKVGTALLLGGIALVAIGAATGNIAFVLLGLGLLGSAAAVKSMSGKNLGTSTSMPSAARMPQMTAMQNIPALANGAVIPPNREFIAKLGDQTSGNNLEGPESLFRQIVREESGGGGTQQHTTILQVDRYELGRLVYDVNNEQTQRVGVRLARP